MAVKSVRHAFSLSTVAVATVATTAALIGPLSGAAAAAKLAPSCGDNANPTTVDNYDVSVAKSVSVGNGATAYARYAAVDAAKDYYYVWGRAAGVEAGDYVWMRWNDYNTSNYRVCGRSNNGAYKLASGPDGFSYANLALSAHDGGVTYWQGCANDSGSTDCTSWTAGYSYF